MPSRLLADCRPELATAWLTIEREYERPNREVILTCTYRSVEEQFALFCQGRVEGAAGLWVKDTDPATQIVTNCDGRRVRSKHNVNPSSALDFAVVIAGKVSWHAPEYEAVGVLAERQGLMWGGRWTSIKDYPHVELLQ